MARSPGLCSWHRQADVLQNKYISPLLFSLGTSSRVPRVPEISGWRALPVSSCGGAACSALGDAVGLGCLQVEPER